MHDAGMTRVPGAPSFHSLIVKGWETTNLDQPCHIRHSAALCIELPSPGAQLKYGERCGQTISSRTCEQNRSNQNTRFHPPSLTFQTTYFHPAKNNAFFDCETVEPVLTNIKSTAYNAPFYSPTAPYPSTAFRPLPSRRQGSALRIRADIHPSEIA